MRENDFYVGLTFNHAWDSEIDAHGVREVMNNMKHCANRTPSTTMCHYSKGIFNVSTASCHEGNHFHVGLAFDHE